MLMFGGQYGVSELKPFVELGCEVANVGEDIVNKKGLFSLFQLTDEAAAMGKVDVTLAVKQAKELDQEDRAELLVTLKEKLDLDNDALEAKIEGGADVVESAIVLGVEAYNDALDYYARTKALAAKAKAVLG